jgi:hypothetical protein
LRAGLIALIAVDGAVGVWQYFFPGAFYRDFPTVHLDPPYNEHLVADVGGLNIALVSVLVFAAATLEYRLVMAALTGFTVYAASHFLFHVLHLEHFSLGEAVAVAAALGFEAVLALFLLVLAWTSRLCHAKVAPATEGRPPPAARSAGSDQGD